MTNFLDIVKHYEACFHEHGDTSKGMDWPSEEENNIRFEIMLDLIKDRKKNNKLLDFGCGTSHLLEYIIKNNINSIDYSGCDLSEIFVNTSKKKHPNKTYYKLDILENSIELPSFDYIICNGVFTEKQNLTFNEMWTYFKKMLLVIFSKANKGIAFNVMSKAVDWEREDLFHLSTDQLIQFVTKKLSRNFIIRNDYGLYEYTMYLYK